MAVIFDQRAGPGRRRPRSVIGIFHQNSDATIETGWQAWDETDPRPGLEDSRGSNPQSTSLASMRAGDAIQTAFTSPFC
jgi:hypothetical protein